MATPAPLSDPFALAQLQELNIYLCSTVRTRTVGGARGGAQRTTGPGRSLCDARFPLFRVHGRVACSDRFPMVTAQGGDGYEALGYGANAQNPGEVLEGIGRGMNYNRDTRCDEDWRLSAVRSGTRRGWLG